MSKIDWKYKVNHIHPSPAMYVLQPPTLHNDLWNVYLLNFYNMKALMHTITSRIKITTIQAKTNDCVLFVPYCLPTTDTCPALFTNGPFA